MLVGVVVRPTHDITVGERSLDDIVVRETPESHEMDGKT